MFLAAASHDLRQPVHALGLFVGALHGVAMALEGRRMLVQIEASITAMNGLFRALLDVSRLDAGVVTVERRPFAIQSVVDRVSRGRDKGRLARLESLHRGGRLRPGAR
jgi:two-component system, sensor histidine kinase